MTHSFRLKSIVTGRIDTRIGVIPLLAIALFVASVTAAAVGTVQIPVSTSAAVVLNQTHLFHFDRTWPETHEIILLQLRLPRVAGAALVGGPFFLALLRKAGRAYGW